MEDIKKLITKTPLIQIDYEYKKRKQTAFVKCEWYSLTGSVKDKVAYQILTNAMQSGLVKQGDYVIEVSSGNMGISICAMANLLGLNAKIIMPKSMSKERQDLIKLYGGELILVENFKEAFELCNKYVKQGYFCSSQFENQSNFNAHYFLTGKEIYDKLKNKSIKSFVCGVGTSGTLMGVGTYLKETVNIKVNGIEPENAQILSNKKPFGHHKLQGLSDEILPKLYNPNIIDKIIQIKDEDAIAMSQKLCKELSLGVGISSGANFLAAVLSGDKSITIFPDDNKKYLSTDLVKPISTQFVEDIKLLNMTVL